MSRCDGQPTCTTKHANIGLMLCLACPQPANSLSWRHTAGQTQRKPCAAFLRRAQASGPLALQASADRGSDNVHRALWRRAHANRQAMHGLVAQISRCRGRSWFIAAQRPLLCDSAWLRPQGVTRPPAPRLLFDLFPSFPALLSRLASATTTGLTSSSATHTLVCLPADTVILSDQLSHSFRCVALSRFDLLPPF